VFVTAVKTGFGGCEGISAALIKEIGENSDHPA